MRADFASRLISNQILSIIQLELISRELNDVAYRLYILGDQSVRDEVFALSTEFELLSNRIMRYGKIIGEESLLN